MSARAAQIRVAIRTRPTAAFDQDELFIDPANNIVQVHHKVNFDAVSNKQEDWAFRFNNILHNSTQDQVYATLVEKMVADACEGRTCCVMMYGQTGSGKTFTMMGDHQSYRNRGVLPRAVAQVFSHVASKPEREYSVYISYMEVYGEQIRDLLVEGQATNGVAPGSAEALGVTVGRDGQLTGGGGSVLQLGDFNISEDPVHGTIVRGLTLVPVDNEADVLNSVYQAEMARTTAHHSLNRTSSRAHSVFTIHIQQRSRLGGGREKIISSKIMLVDLAGSERIKKTMGSGPMSEGQDAVLQRESMVINRSLSYLEACVVALSNPSRTHVPYKNARLTQVLKDALGGSCNTTLVACIWGEARHLEECISTLKFAQRMMSVRTHVAEAPTYVDPEAMLIKLGREVAQLKQELQMHDALADRTSIQYGDYTPEQQAQLARQVKAFMSARDEDSELAALPLESVAQMREALRQAKALVRQAAVEAEEKLQQQYALVPKGDTAAAAALTGSLHAAGGGGGGGHSGSSGSTRFADGAAGVGSIDEAVSGVGLGLASASSRPGTVQLPQTISSRLGATGADFGAHSVASMSFSSTGGAASAHSPLRGGGGGSSNAPRKMVGHGSTITQSNMALDLNGAWRQFKTTPALGAESAAEVAALKRKLGAMKDEAAACVRTANESKQRIETLSKMLVAHAHSQARPASAQSAAESTTSGRPGTAGKKPGSGKGSLAGGDAAVDPEEEARRREAERKEEEQRMVAELGQAKKSYRAATERLPQCKDACTAIQDHINVHMAAMVRDFETWYASMTGRLPPIPVSPTRDRSGSPFKSGGRQQGFGATAIYDWQQGAVGGGGSSDDALDDQEAFEELEMAKVTAGEPESFAFFAATRPLRQGQRPTGGKRSQAPR